MSGLRQAHTVRGWCQTRRMPITLTGATVKVRSTDVVLKWSTSEPVPDDGTVTFSTTFIDDLGATIRQLGFKLIDSRWVASFVFDHVGARNEYVQAKPQRTGDWWSIAFPLEALGGIASGKWRADLSLEAYDTPSVEGAI